MMKKKILSLALALALCLGLTVPAFAETLSETIDGITITIDSSGTISFTGSGAFTKDHVMTAAVGLYVAADRNLENLNRIDTVTFDFGPGITTDLSLEQMSEIFNYEFSEHVAGIHSFKLNSTSVVRTVGGFTDVKPSDYFADPVVWAVDKKITAGTSATTFSPDADCTVAQIVSFLWRAYGSPKVSSIAGSMGNPFSDVKSSDYYYGAALWAYNKGIVTGSTFGGDRPCTRSMAVDYIWKADAARAFYIETNGYVSEYYYLGDGGRDTVVPNVVIPDHVVGIYPISLYYCKRLASVTIPTSVTTIDERAFDGCNGLTDIYYEGSEEQWQAIDIAPNNDALSKATIHYNSEKQPVNTGFTDVSSTADYAEAVKWAVDNGITAGTSATTFSPDSVCTRGQIVSFLYRALKK